MADKSRDHQCYLNAIVWLANSSSIMLGEIKLFMKRNRKTTRKNNFKKSLYAALNERLDRFKYVDSDCKPIFYYFLIFISMLRKSNRWSCYLEGTRG